MGFIAVAPCVHSPMRPEPLPPQVFEPTRQGFLAAYRHELLRETQWHGDDKQLAAILANAERTLSSTRISWRHDTAEAARAFTIVTREPSRVSLTRLRSLPDGQAFKAYEIAINVFHLTDSNAFEAWLKSHGHHVQVLMRHNCPSRLGGQEVRIGHRPLRDRSDEERIIDCLYSLYLNETRRAPGVVQH